MSDFIRVFCRSDRALTPAELASFIRDGAYFDEDPDVHVDRVRLDGSWESVVIRYDSTRRPIVLWRNVDDQLLRAERQELIEAFEDEVSSEAIRQLVDWLRGARVVYALEASLDGLSEDAWTMLDTLEAYIARECDGIVYAPGDGVFDADLQPLLSIGG